MNDLELRVFAATVLGEARGEGPDGMQAVAHVIVNRVNHESRWPDTVGAVCLEPAQFSFWNGDSRRRWELLSAEDFTFGSAQIWCIRVSRLGLPDITDGATHYYNPDLASPSWADELEETVVIGQHRFMK